MLAVLVGWHAAGLALTTCAQLHARMPVVGRGVDPTAVAPYRAHIHIRPTGSSDGRKDVPQLWRADLLSDTDGAQVLEVRARDDLARKRWQGWARIEVRELWRAESLQEHLQGLRRQVRLGPTGTCRPRHSDWRRGMRTSARAIYSGVHALGHPYPKARERLPCVAADGIIPRLVAVATPFARAGLDVHVSTPDAPGTVTRSCHSRRGRRVDGGPASAW